MDLGSTIKRLRSERGVKQKDLASDLSITASYLSQIENGHREPALSLIKEIADELGVPVPILLFMSLEDEDVPVDKRESFRMLSGPVSALFESVFSSDSSN